jgi:hypothetical protein
LAPTFWPLLALTATPSIGIGIGIGIDLVARSLYPVLLLRSSVSARLCVHADWCAWVVDGGWWDQPVVGVVSPDFAAVVVEE